MAEHGSSSVDAGGDSSPATSRSKSSFVKVGDRVRFTAELRPEETTIVSWKKLMKDAAKGDGGGASSFGLVADAPAPEVPTNAHPSLKSRLAPGQLATHELTDAAPPNRYSAVIEKIERLYMGKDSSDDEDMGDVPDDDQYDTEDSFIDDEELDEYFEVDKVRTKHDGYFVNRGTLEKISEPTESLNQQPNKRKRKEMSKAPGDSDNGHPPGKHMKVGKKGAGKSALSLENTILPGSQGLSVQSSEEKGIQSQVNASASYYQNIAGRPLVQSLRASNGDASSSLLDSSEKQKTGVLPAKTSSSKRKENNPDEPEGVKQEKEKNGMGERIDLNLPNNKQTMQLVKKPKTSLLEKAIRELERMVAESRPQPVDAQNADGSSQFIKRRLSREIKAKLDKVAIAINGKVSIEVLNRLMGIVGHVIQIRTLKRHLKSQMNTTLSTKHEKEDKFQLAKKEVIEMVNASLPSIMSKVAELQSGGSGDLQEPGNSDKALKGQLYMDTTLEDKICDLYDIFVDGLEEDATPQIRKLYAELAELFPKGVMNNRGIKHAICRAKERKKTLNENEEKEKIKRKKIILPKMEDTAQVESSSAAQPQPVDVSLGTSNPNIPVTSQSNHKSISNITSISSLGSIMSPASATVLPAPNFERSKQEKEKGIHSSSSTETRTVDGIVVKKKVKRKIENQAERHSRPEKLSSSLNSNERQKQSKHSSASLQSQTTAHKSGYSEFCFEPLT